MKNPVEQPSPRASGNFSGPLRGDSAAAVAALVGHLRATGATSDDKVLAAIASTPRHLFIPDATIAVAYRDEPQPIGLGQTISQPTVVAMMTDALELTGRESVLEIGTGCGYQTAVLAKLAREVRSIEVLPHLGEVARERLAWLGHDNVEVRVGDGYRGWPEHAPFDRIVVTAAPPELPQALVDQLADGGILVAPIGGQDRVQRLLRLRKDDGVVSREDLGAVRFVPMVPLRS